MATLYWGSSGGTSTGTWNSSGATNWFTDIGRTTPAVSAPTLADDVVFDVDSDAGAPFTVTVGAGAICKNLTASGLDQTMTLAGTAILTIHGSVSFPATNFTRTFTGGITFAATTTGNTITVSYTGNVITTGQIIFNGVNGEWTLGSNLAYGSSGDQAILFRAGTLKTANYSMTGGGWQLDNIATAVLELGSSTITISPAGGRFIVLNSANYSIDAGTSTINFSSFNCIFNGGTGFTYHNVLFSDTSVVGNQNVQGNNTFNNLSIGSRPLNIVSGFVFFGNQTINGTLTLGSGNTPVRRLFVRSDTLGTQRTITINGTLASANDVDFRDININGTFGTISGTRFGDCRNNSGITFDAPKTVYFVGTTSANWSATTWSLSSNGATSVNNFPLAQDIAMIDDSSLNTSATLTVDSNYAISTVNFSSRLNAITFALGSQTPFIYGDVVFASSVTLTGTGLITFAKQNSTQTITSASVTIDQPVTVDSKGGAVQLLDNLTIGSARTFTLTNGALDLSNQTLSTGLFASNNSNTRSILFGTGNITTTGVGTVWTTATPTNLTVTGTPVVNVSNNTATATTVATGALTEAQSISFNYLNGTYALTDTAAVYRSLNFTGFAGVAPNSVRTIYGSLTLSSGMTLTAGANTTTFASTAAGNTITTAGKTVDYPLVFNGVNGVWSFQDALAQGSTRAFTITNGTVQLKDGVTSTVGAFSTTGTTQKFLQSTLAGSQATLSQASGTVNASYLTIQDINATGGATWNAFTTSNNVDGGNNDGWDFSTQIGRYIFTRRKNKRILP